MAVPVVISIVVVVIILVIPDLIGERAVGVEDLDAVVVGVGHGNDAAGAEGYAFGSIELAGARPRRSGS